MKKIKLYHSILLMIAFCLCLSSCSYIDNAFSHMDEKFRQHQNIEDPKGRQPLEAFTPNASEYGVTKGMIPEDLLDRFEYIDGYFHFGHYANQYFTFEFSERALLFLEYDQDTYLQAKDWMFEKLDLASDPIEEYNGYIFYDNFSYDNQDAYPKRYRRIAFNDSKNIIVSISCYTSSGHDDNIESISDDFGAHLNAYYGEWYDFSE